MIRRIAMTLSLLSLAAAAHADSENVRKWRDQLNFQPVASGEKGASKGGASGGGASGGSSAPAATEEKQHRFRRLDIDGDGFVSKAEAAGNAPATLGFDRADRNRDGKLSFAEYDSIGKPPPARKKVARGQGSASAGASKKAN